MNVNKKVAVVIVNWNKINHITNLLNQLKSIKSDNFDIIVVDNGSTDNSQNIIKTKFPYVSLIEQETNLGGTGGFNSGIKFALDKNIYDYIWLLDNDVEIHENALNELLQVIDSDNQIGIAGSRIIDIENKDYTVALGGVVKRNTIGVIPYYRNKKLVDKSFILETDYTAICSALVRTSAIKDIGLMDERMFLFWDDIDWGLSFKENGYKVVAVPNSNVYHPNFTEKDRGIFTTYYYGIRNPLLVYSKHTKGLKRLYIFYNNLRYLCKGILLLIFIKNYSQALFSFNAIIHFCINKWGKINKSIDDIENKTQKINQFKDSNPKRILIVSSDNRQDIFKLKDKLNILSPNSEITLLITEDRKEIYKNVFKNLFTINQDKKENILYVVWIMLKLFFSRYDLSIITNNSTNLYSYATFKTYQYHSKKDFFTESDINLYHSYKLFMAFILGEFFSLLVLPIVYVCSFKYKSKRTYGKT